MDDRNPYGARTVETIAQELVFAHGQGFSVKNLRRMIQFANQFPDEQIVVTLSRQLSWSHFVSIIPVRQDLAREFYAQMCQLERWSVRQLRRSIDSMLFERIALSKKAGNNDKSGAGLTQTG